MNRRMTDKDIRDAEKHLSMVDPVLARVIKQCGPCRVRRMTGGVHRLAEIIINQQLAPKAAAAIFGRLLKAAGCRRLAAEQLDKISDRRLRAAGVSPQKLKYLRDLTAKVLDGSLRINRLPAMSDEQVLESITQVKGLGRWSAEMYLMFVLARPDVFSPGDRGLQLAIEELYGVDCTKIDLDEFAERWKPYRTVAAWYLWTSRRQAISF